MPAASSVPSSSASEREAPPTSPVAQVVRGAFALAAWPLALLGPVVICRVAAGIVTGRISDEQPEGTCTGIGFGCSLTPRQTVELYSLYAAGPVILLAVAVGAAVASGMPARRRFRAVVVMLAAQALLAALVGVTVVRLADDLL